MTMIGVFVAGCMGDSAPPVANTTADGNVSGGADPCADVASATHKGTEGPDEIDGTDEPDVIFGLGGDDVIRAHSGDDIVCGGPGNDTLGGGPGFDTIIGGEGTDTCKGGPDANAISECEGA